MTSKLELTIWNWIEDRTELLKFMKGLDLSPEDYEHEVNWGYVYLRLVTQGEGLDYEKYRDLYTSKLEGVEI